VIATRNLRLHPTNVQPAIKEGRVSGGQWRIARTPRRVVLIDDAVALVQQAALQSGNIDMIHQLVVQNGSVRRIAKGNRNDLNLAIGGGNHLTIDPREGSLARIRGKRLVVVRQAGTEAMSADRCVRP
jgi:hypothetical protein